MGTCARVDNQRVGYPPSHQLLNSFRQLAQYTQHTYVSPLSQVRTCIVHDGTSANQRRVIIVQSLDGEIKLESLPSTMHFGSNTSMCIVIKIRQHHTYYIHHPGKMQSKSSTRIKEGWCCRVCTDAKYSLKVAAFSMYRISMSSSAARVGLRSPSGNSGR
jgi:hypothetical protein